MMVGICFFFSSRRRHTRLQGDWSSDVCSSDLAARFVWAVIGTAAMQKGPLWWAGHHVNHHKFADRDGDPHSPMISGFYYAHIGWFLNDTKYDRVEATNPVVRDFSKVPELAWLERYFFLPPLALAVTLFLVGGFPWLVWGFCLPTM